MSPGSCPSRRRGLVVTGDPARRAELNSAIVSGSIAGAKIEFGSANCFRFLEKRDLAARRGASRIVALDFTGVILDAPQQIYWLDQQPERRRKARSRLRPLRRAHTTTAVVVLTAVVDGAKRGFGRTGRRVARRRFILRGSGHRCCGHRHGPAHHGSARHGSAHHGSAHRMMALHCRLRDPCRRMRLPHAMHRFRLGRAGHRDRSEARREHDQHEYSSDPARNSPHGELA